MLKHLQNLSKRYTVAPKETRRSIQPCNWSRSKILPVAYRGTSAVCDINSEFVIMGTKSVCYACNAAIQRLLCNVCRDSAVSTNTSFPGICSWETSAVGVATAQRMHLLCGNDTRSCQTMIMTPPWQCSPHTQSMCAAQAICAGTCSYHCTSWETGRAGSNFTLVTGHTPNIRCALLIRADIKAARIPPFIELTRQHRQDHSCRTRVA